MKNFYLTILTVITTLLYSSALSAQVSINELSIPIIGDSAVIAICSDLPAPGDSGTDVTWDMSTLTETEEQYFLFRDPSETLWADDFPEATMAGISWEENVTYYKLDDVGLNVVGEASIINQSDTFLLTYDNDETFIELPQMYNDMTSDEFSGTSSALGFNVPFTGNVNLEVDGEGTLILPNGTYSNVLRYHLDRVFTTSFMGNETSTSKEQWGWWSPEYRFWLLIMETTVGPLSTSNLVWYNKSPEPIIPLSNGEIQESTLSVFPNPSSTEEPIYFVSDLNELNAAIQVFDMQGRVISSITKNIVKGLNSVEHHLDSGIYLLQINSKNLSSNTRLIVSE